MTVVDLIFERVELESRMHKLDSFLNETNRLMPDEQRKIVVNQLAFMQAYKRCLEQRIALLGFAPADQCVHYYKTNESKKQDLEDDLNAGWKTV